MGCCESKQNHPNGKIHRKSGEVSRKGAVTGIMDEAAPLTTAPKLNVEREGLVWLADKLVDVLQGEQLVINDRIPEKESTSRLYIYEQLLLSLREVIHNLNESCQLNAAQLPPSQVMDLIAYSRVKSTPIGPVELPAPQVRKAPPLPTFKPRLRIMSAWLRVACTKRDNVEIDYKDLIEFHKLAGLSTPVHEILMSKPGGGSYAYKDVCHASVVHERENLKFLRTKFEEVAGGVDLMLTRQNFVKHYGETSGVEFDQILAKEELGHRQEGRWSFREYCLYMMGGDNLALDGKKTGAVTHNMARPITEYLVNTSAYSWLVTREQLTSDSSLHMIEMVLTHGCRSIELGICDGPEGEPIVQLAWTKNRFLRLEECLTTIAATAFRTNPYPLVISATLNFGTEQDSRNQMDQVAQHFQAILGKYLVTWGADLEPPELSTVTPESLKGKIILECEKRWHEVAKTARGSIITSPSHSREAVVLGMRVVNVKAKVGVKILTVGEGSPAEAAGIMEGGFVEGVNGERISSVDGLKEKLRMVEVDDVRVTVNQREYKVIQGQAVPGMEFPTSPVAPPELGNGSLNASFDEHMIHESSDDGRPEVLKQWKQSKVKAKMGGEKYKKLKVSSEVSALVYLKRTGRKIENFGEDAKWWEVIHTQPTGIDYAHVAQNSAQQLYRVHPPKASLNSENTHPTPLWDAGIQFVGAFYHSPGESLGVHLANFADNGSCGWVHKATPPTPLGDTLTLTVHCLASNIYVTGEDVDGYVLKCYESREGGYEEAEGSAPSEYCKWDKTYQFEGLKEGGKKFITLAVTTENAPSTVFARAVVRADLLRPGLRCISGYSPENPIDERTASHFMCSIEFS